MASKRRSYRVPINMSVAHAKRMLVARYLKYRGAGRHMEAEQTWTRVSTLQRYTSYPREAALHARYIRFGCIARPCRYMPGGTHDGK